jgi:hypothetical protein
MSSLFRKSIITGIVLFCFFEPVYLLGAEKMITTSLSAGQMYDDNIYLYSTEKRDDFISIIRASGSLDYKTERTDIKGRVNLNIWRYNEENELNTVDQIYSLDTNFSSSERLRLGMTGRYTKDTTLETELTETGVGLVRSIRKNYFLSPSATYALSERDTLSFSPFYTSSNYESDTYNDYWVSGATANYKHIFKDERLTLIAQAGYNYVKIKPREYEYDFFTLSSEGRYHTCQLYGGVSYLLSETLTMNILLGVSYTDSVMKRKTALFGIYPVSKTEDKDKTFGWVGNANLSKTLEKGSVTVGARRELSPSGLGELLETNRIYIFYINKFTEKLQGELDASYYRGKGLGRIKTYHTWNIIPTLHYYIKKYLTVDLNYSYTYYESDTHSERNTVFLGITWLWSHIL